MKEANRSAYGRWVALGLSLAVSVTLTAMGCGGGTDSGDANFTQKFEKPATEAGPPPKEKPIPYKDLDPREKKQRKAEESGEK